MKDLTVTVRNFKLSAEERAFMNRLLGEGKIQVMKEPPNQPEDILKFFPVLDSDFLVSQNQMKLRDAFAEHGELFIKHIIKEQIDEEFYLDLEVMDWDIVLNHDNDDEPEGLFMPDYEIVVDFGHTRVDSKRVMKKMIDTFDVDDFTSCGNRFLIRCYAGDGPFVSTVNDVLNHINYYGPRVSEKLRKLGISNYEVTFIISQLFRL